MPTIDDILRARREASLFDRVQGGSSTTAAAPTIFDRLAPSSPMQGITLGSILERGGQTLGRLGREVPNEIAANYADMVEAVRNNPGAFGPAALPITLANIARGYQQGQERQARGGEPSLTETPFATHTSGDPTVKGAAMIADPGNLVGTGVGAKVATGLAKLLGGAKGVNQALIAFHGSPHKFAPVPENPLGKFDPSKIGTGEGAQAYGVGAAYLAEQPSTAAAYKQAGVSTNWADHINKIGDTVFDQLGPTINGKVPFGPNQKLYSREEFKALNEANPTEVWARLAPSVRTKVENIITPKGHLYKVDLPDEHIPQMFDWDKPLREQPQGVKDAINRVARDPRFAMERISDDMKGTDLSKLLRNPAAVKELQRLGVTGVRYLDAGSRLAGTGTRNFIVYDPEHANILSRE